MGLIELKDAVKKYDIGKETEVAALAGTSLTIEKGEMIAITGPSGSGKTTLLKIIAGIEKLSSGQYCWNGQDVETMKEKETCRLRNTDIGFISQDYSLLEEESTLFNVCLPQMIGGRHTKENRSNAMKVMDEVGLMGLYRKPAGMRPSSPPAAIPPTASSAPARSSLSPARRRKTSCWSALPTTGARRPS